MNVRLSGTMLVSALGIAFCVRADLKPVRPGNPEMGAPFWNRNAAKFIYPPAFDFRQHWMAKEYRFTVWGADGKPREFRAAKPWAPLTPVWDDLPVGRTVVLCEGVSADNVVPVVSTPRVFWKDAVFTGKYPPKARSYREAARMAYEFLFRFEPFATFMKTGRPDPGFDKNGYPSKTHAATIRAMLAAAEVLPEHREEALKLARLAGDFLLAGSLGPDSPLPGWPLTYLTADGQKCQHPESKGRIMLLYPAEVGIAYVDLFKATGETKWKDGALQIARTYLKVRRSDGSWPLVVDEKTGVALTENPLVPIQPMELFRRIGTDLNWWEFRNAAGECQAWIEREIVAGWDWEGQFEDVAPSARYDNLTKHNCLDYMLYRLRNFPKADGALGFASDALRFAEDQFVFWEVPYNPKDGTCVFCPQGDGGSGGRGRSFRVPCVVEQYACYNPVDGSAAKLILGWIAYGKAAKDEPSLAKARAMADSMTRMQTPEGYIPTWWWGDSIGLGHDPWINCHILSAEALRLAAETFEAE